MQHVVSTCVVLAILGKRVHSLSVLDVGCSPLSLFSSSYGHEYFIFYRLLISTSASSTQAATI